MPVFIDSIFQRLFPGATEIAVISQWFFLTRIMGSIAIAIGIIFLNSIGAINFATGPILLGLIPAYLAVNFLWLLGTKIKTAGRAYLYLQMLVDTLTITVGIYLSGGIHSEFIYLYLMVILSAAVISLRAVATMALASLTLYIVGVGAEQLGWFAPASASHIGFHADEAVRITVYSIIVTIIAFQSYFYISRIKKKDEELLKLKDEFVFRTIHSLRSPSTAIRWILEKWSRPEMAERYPETREDVAMVRQLNDEIIALIQDLANLAKGKEMTLRQERFNITAVIQSLLKEFEHAIREKRLTVEYAPETNLPMVLADSERTREVFGNLIDNAIKYNRVGGKIIITHHTDGAFLKTSIADTGGGIEPKHISRIFEPYFRGGAGKEIPGTGLGLYIVKALCEKMRGRVMVESTPGKGSVFSIFLPIAQ